MEKLNTWKFIVECMAEAIPVALLYVVSSSGSSPGRQGFLMAVNAKGILHGSIGGGIMEHKFVEMAKAQLATGELTPRIFQQYHDKIAASNQSGMICSGEQTILLCQVQEKDIPALQKIITCMENITIGQLQLSPQGIEFHNVAGPEHFSFIDDGNGNWNYSENLNNNSQLYIVGGGHCALALSKLMSSLDFNIYLFDNRTGLNTFDSNHYAREKTILQDYSQLPIYIQEGLNNFVVIMSFGYRTDDIAIRSLINKQFAYFGVLGSKTKIDKMFTDYRNEGISEELIRRIKAPIGLRIKSETPEEIAVSIAAEIISVKNKVKR